jgi:hypothetical protein
VAVVVDVAGPVMFVVDGDDLRELAAGSLLVPVRVPAAGEVGLSGRYGWVTPDR